MIREWGWNDIRAHWSYRAHRGAHWGIVRIMGWSPEVAKVNGAASPMGEVWSHPTLQFQIETLS